MIMHEAQRGGDPRQSGLRAWVECRLAGARAWQAASEDASFRRHFRVEDGSGCSWIAIDAPPEHEDTMAYVRIAERLRACGLHVPEVRDADHARGFLLVSDLGRERYLEALAPGNADRLYADAAAALARMQARADPAGLPEYDERLLQEEMQLFEDWLLGRHLGYAPDAVERRMLRTARRRLTAAVLAQPRVFVHRDYHSRNLMHTCPNPGILDFQDAVRGPYAYDLASLLKDCYLHWPGCLYARVGQYLERAGEEGLPRIDEEVCLKDLDLAGAQRHLKAAGIFARLMYRDGKPSYLASIPRTLGYLAALQRPETAALSAWIGERVLPASERICAP